MKDIIFASREGFLGGGSFISAHYTSLIFYNNGTTHQPSPLYIPLPLLLCGHGGMMVHDSLEEVGRVNSDDGYNGGG